MSSGYFGPSLAIFPKREGDEAEKFEGQLGGDKRSLVAPRNRPSCNA